MAQCCLCIGPLCFSGLYEPASKLRVCKSQAKSYSRSCVDLETLRILSQYSHVYKVALNQAIVGVRSLHISTEAHTQLPTIEMVTVSGSGLNCAVCDPVCDAFSRKAGT